MRPGNSARWHWPGSIPAECRVLLRALIFTCGLLAGLAIALVGWHLARQGGPGYAGMALLLVYGIALLCSGAVVHGAIAMMALRRLLQAPPGPAPAQGVMHAPGLAEPEPPRWPKTSPATVGHPGWVSVWPSDIAADTPASAAPGESGPRPAHEAAGGAPWEPSEWVQAAERMTATAGTLSKEADELSACSLDLSALANGTLRSASTADEHARTAFMDVAEAVLAVTGELAAHRTGREAAENCLIHARVTRRLVQQTLALASRVTPQESHAAQDAPICRKDDPDLPQLSADCLQAVDRMAALAADSRAHFRAAEDVTRTRMKALESLAGNLQALATVSYSLVRMNQSQVDYGNNIAHLAGRLAMGAACLNDDLQQTFPNR